MPNEIKDFDEHPFNDILNALMEKLEIKKSFARVVKLVTPQQKLYTYIEIDAKPVRKLDTITDLFSNLIKIANNYVPFNIFKDLNGYNYIELDKSNINTGPRLLQMADQIANCHGYEHFRRGFSQLSNLPTENEFRAETGRVLRTAAYLQMDQGKIIYGFRMTTNDERIIEQAKKLGDISTVASSQVKGQYSITSQNGGNEQMSQLLAALPFISAGKPQAQLAGR